MVSSILYYAVPTVVILYGIRKYRESKWGKCNNVTRLDGKNVLITGANSGIGYETALELAKRGANIIFACRNEKLALKAIERIRKELKTKSNIDFVKVDLASIASITEFANEIKSRYDKIDILINNAGLSYPNNKRIETENGLEIHFGVNYLSHFLLTHLLIDLLKKSDTGRIINVSSLLHQKGTIDLDDLNYETRKLKNPYADSKLAMMYFGKELAKRTFDTNINVYSLCPGWVSTNLFRHNLKNIFRLILAIPIALLFMRNKKQGAQTTIFCATDTKIEKESGGFYRECRKFVSTHKFEDQVGKQLWIASEKMLHDKGAEFDSINAVCKAKQ